MFKKTGFFYLFLSLSLLICLFLSTPECFAQNLDKENNCKIQLIRNATMKITYAGFTFLTDPMFSPKGAIKPFAGIEPNPTKELPLKIEDIIKGVDCVLVTHLHPDHLDTVACEALPKKIPLFCQPGDEDAIKNSGFINIAAVETSREWNGITIIRTGGKHGSGKILEHMGKVSGYIFTAKNQPTLYWAGDSVLCDEVKYAVNKYKPEIIITHSGGAKIPGFDPIIMDSEQTIKLANIASKASIVAIHMESLDHCAVMREALRGDAEKAGIPSSKLIIPKDGETLSF